jgi:hypothetical protein
MIHRHDEKCDFYFVLVLLDWVHCVTSTVVKCRAFAGSTACLIGTLLAQRVEGFISSSLS